MSAILSRPQCVNITWHILDVTFFEYVNDEWNFVQGFSKGSILPYLNLLSNYDDVIKWKHFPRYWPFVWGIHRSPVNSPHKGQWRGALMFSLISVWINGWVNSRDADDLRRYLAHYDVIVMKQSKALFFRDKLLHPCKRVACNYLFMP